MTKLEQIQQDMKQAMLDKDSVKVSTLRMVIAAADNARIAKGGELTDDEVVKLLQKEAKQRDEAIAGAKQGGREDLIEKNLTEKKVLEPYLPAQMDPAKLEEMVVTTIHEIGAAGPGDMGKVMAAVMPKLAGQADGATVSRLVSQHLGS